jgi:hypothetical protein
MAKSAAERACEREMAENKWPLSDLALQGLKEINYRHDIERMRRQVAEYDRQQREPPPTPEQLAQEERECYREIAESRFW